MKKKDKLSYYLSQCFYWAAALAISGYVVVYLQEYRFTYTEIGLVMSVANILACLIQPLMASYLSKPGTPQVKMVLYVYFSASIAILLLLAVMPLGVLARAVAYTLLYMLNLVILPLFNAITIHLINSGYRNIDFGISRGYGSFTFSLSSIILGKLVANFGVISILIFSIGSYFLTYLALVNAHIPDENKVATKEAVITTKLNIRKYITFVDHHKRYFLIITAVLFTFTYYYAIGQYALNIGEMLGGDRQSLGGALAINAFVEVPALLSFNKIAKRIDIKKILILSSIFFCMKGAVYLIGTNVTYFYMAQLFQAISFALYLPAVTIFATSIMAKKDNLIAQSLLTTAFTIGGVIGSYLGGRFIDLFSVRQMIIYMTPIALIGTVLIAISTIEFKKGATKR